MAEEAGLVKSTQGVLTAIYGIITVLVVGFIVFKISSNTGTQITLVILILGLLVFLS